MGILWEFFKNSLGILSELFGDVWLGGSECLGVDLRLNGRQGWTRKTITRSARRALSRLKRMKKVNIDGSTRIELDYDY